MDVFLIPAGQGRYELYCEIGEQPAAAGEGVTRGWRRRLVDGFSTIVNRVEAARHGAAHRRATGAQRTFTHRLRDRAVCWLAEKIAEQRLLWHLRSQADAILWFPDDIPEREASDRLRSMLRADADRHLRWFLIDGAGLVASLALIPIPGPNLILYYFTFRAGGHYLSRHGAHHGLEHVTWHPRASRALAELREAVALEPEVRARRVTEIASQLRLQHLAAFFERIAEPAP